MNSPHIFADRMLNVAVTGPLVRIELGTMQMPTGEGQTPQLQATETLVLPLDGFLASYSMLESVVKKMLADGMVTPRQPEPAAITK